MLQIQNHKIHLLERPKLGKIVTTVYEITTDNNYKDLTVKFCNFTNVKPVGKDAVFIYDAVKGVPRTFRVRLQYFSTPATFSVVISKHKYSRIPSLTLTRYLLNTRTGEYGSLKEVQYLQPIEYRFNPHRKVFEEIVFDLEKDRWQKNRAIIDTLKTITPDYPDSVCLVLYADIFKANYPADNGRYKDKARYLLKQGWRPLNDAERATWFKKINDDKANEIKKQEVANRRRQKLNDIKWLASWILPLILLTILAVILLVLNSRKKKPAITPKIFDRLAVYCAYIIAIAVVFYFSWPYLGIREIFKKKPVELVRHKEAEASFLESVYNKHILDQFSEFRKTSLEMVSMHDGHSAIFRFADAKQLRFNLVYQFTVEICSTEGRWLYPEMSFASIVKQVISQFENNRRVNAILKKYHPKHAVLETTNGQCDPGVMINDTISIKNSQQQLFLKYDRSDDAITEFIVPVNFEDSLFPEIARFKQLCLSAGMRLKEKSCIKYNANSGLSARTENSDEDILCVRFFSDRADDFTYQWIPIPKHVEVPDSIISQVLSRIVEAGLSREYVRDKIKFIRSYGTREPEYFQSQGDRVVLYAIFKWQTDIDWIDNMNKGKGAYFEVLYEYFAGSLKLGRCLGLPGRHVSLRPQWSSEGFYLRPIGKMISKKEAWDKLFDCLGDEERFIDIYPELNFAEKPTSNGDLLYLRGWRGARVDLETGTAYKVNDPYGVICTATTISE